MLTVRPLNTGWIPVAPEQYFYHSPALPYKKIPQGRVELPAFAFLIEGGPFPLLVDTGMPDTLRANRIHPKSHSGAHQDPGMELSAQLKKAGYSPGDIPMVILTHLHWDHIGGLPAFKGAQLFVHPQEYAFAQNPIPPYYRAYEHARIGETPSFSGCSFNMIGEGWEPFPGIHILETPGHSPGHLSVEVETASGRYLCAGDALFLRENLDPTPQLNYDITPPGKLCSLIDGWHSVQKIAARTASRALLLPSHDRALWDLIQRTPVLGTGSGG